MPDSILAELQAVDFVRDDARILRGIDWRVIAGEHWVILGPNGSGKSTALRLIAAQLHPTNGTAQVLGETLGKTDVRRLRRRIAFSGGAITREFDRSAAVAAIVATGTTAALATWWDEPSAIDRQRAALLMDELGIASIADRPFGVVSEGERQKAILARALMSQAELVLLDEPFAGLDMGARERLLQRLSRIAGSGQVPLVLVTHHLEEVPSGITHAMLMRDGQAVASGALADVFTDQLLSETFGLALRVERTDDRWTCRSA